MAGAVTVSPQLLSSLDGAYAHARGRPRRRRRVVAREREILVAVCRGLSNQEIADELFISKRTVDKHRANILEKTGCKNTASLVVYAIRKGDRGDLTPNLNPIPMKKILCLAMCAVFAAALPARAQSDEYRDAVAEMMELTGALRNADVVVTQMIGYLKTSAPSVSEAVWEKIISKFNEKMRARMVDIYVPIYSKYLTLADLRELNALYAKPVMRKAVGATPAIMQEGMSAGAALGQEIMTELQRELQAEGYE